MVLFSLTFILLGTIILLFGFSNRKRRASKGEKTTTGKVEAFGLIENNKFFAHKYRVVVKTGLKKYEIEAYSMPWLKKGEEVSFQMTGKQKILGNERLSNKSKLQLFVGVVLIIFPFVMLFAK